jgi:spoIIIJ-associated protein
VEENQVQRNSAGDLSAEGSGKTVADAEADAIVKLEEITGPLEPDRVEVEVLEEGSKGFLGMGSNLARVRVRLPAAEVPGAADEGEGPEPGTPDMVEEAEGVESGGNGAEGDAEAGEAGETVPAPGSSETARERLADYMDKVMDAIGLDGTVDFTEDEESITCNVSGSDLGIFIGRHGQTIDAVQYLANIISFRGLEGRKRVIVDAEDYRQRRTESLKTMAERAVSELEKGLAEYELNPMSAAERRIIHIYLQDREGVETASEGRDPFRRVVITRVED